MEHSQSSPLWRRSATAAACAAVLGVGAAVAPAVAGAAFNFKSDLRDFAPAAAGPFDGASAKLTWSATTPTPGVSSWCTGVDPSVAGRTFGAHLHVGPCVAGNGAGRWPHYNHSTTPPDGQRPDRDLAGLHRQRRGQRPDRPRVDWAPVARSALGGHPRRTRPPPTAPPGHGSRACPWSGDDGAPRHALLRAALVGSGLGAAWGVAARAWMRLVSTSPEFSWSGTLMIVGLSAIFGLSSGCPGGRVSDGTAAVVEAAVACPALVLFAGRVLPLAPGFLVAGPLLRRRGTVRAARQRWSRSSVRLSCSGGRTGSTRTTMLGAPLHVQVGLLFGMPVLATALALAGHLVDGAARRGRLSRCRPNAPAAADAATPVSRCRPAPPDPRRPTRRGRTPPRRGCSRGGTARCRARGRGSAG